MNFQATPIEGVFEVQTDWYRDVRGTFGRIFCQREFSAHGLTTNLVQCNLSNNPQRGTLRGLHLQAGPHQEAKLVCCVAGSIFDVALDLRSNSPTYGRHYVAELRAGEGRMLYIPEGCAHGYQTLENNSSMMYYVSAFHEPAAERGVRWNDPAINVRWPLADEAIVSERDQHLPLLADYQTHS